MERGLGHILFISILYFNAYAVPSRFLLSLISKKTAGTIGSVIWDGWNDDNIS